MFQRQFGSTIFLTRREQQRPADTLHQRRYGGWELCSSSSSSAAGDKCALLSSGSLSCHGSVNILCTLSVVSTRRCDDDHRVPSCIPRGCLVMLHFFFSTPASLPASRTTDYVYIFISLFYLSPLMSSSSSCRGHLYILSGRCPLHSPFGVQTFSSRLYIYIPLARCGFVCSSNVVTCFKSAILRWWCNI